jgi:hypothetical protein
VLLRAVSHSILAAEKSRKAMQQSKHRKSCWRTAKVFVILSEQSESKELQLLLPLLFARISTTEGAPSFERFFARRVGSPKASHLSHQHGVIPSAAQSQIRARIRKAAAP